jgi:ribulose kinase
VYVSLLLPSIQISTDGFPQTQLEMEIPKILWLKNHMPPEVFKQCRFFDLPDYLTYRATSAPLRSFCSLACKCSYVPSQGGWQADFFKQIGLQEFVDEEYERLGGRDGEVKTAGMPVGEGLSKQAAEEMGLKAGTPVGSGVIDA